ncbi:MAG: S8 family serine peptidase [Clostridia bacterium]|nr:S8 family serine peptidase [Clostridia bacterium]
MLTQIALECKKSYINEIANISAVASIDYLNCSTEGALFSETETSSVTDYNIDNYGYYMTPHNTLGYDGSGIRIGVLEYDETSQIRYDSTNPHLTNRGIITNVKDSTLEIPDNEENVSQHATDMLSVLAGSPVTVNDITYQGIATGATVYYTNIACFERVLIGNEYHIDIESSLEWFINQNVSIINLSWGEFYKTKDEQGNTTGYIWGYNVVDNQVDKIVREYGVTITVAAGNYHMMKEVDSTDRYNVSNPASAYTVITVGNVSCNQSYEDLKYPIYRESCYKEESFATNKPDLVMFGTKFYMYDYDEESELIVQKELDPGTSISSSVVAATASLMMQANPGLVGKPCAVKALLLGSADKNAVRGYGVKKSSFSTFNTSCVSNIESYGNDQFGVGLLDIKAAIRSANSKLLYTYLFYPENYLAEGVTERYYFNAGTNIKFGIVYEKNNDNLIRNIDENQTIEDVLATQNNLEVQIINSNGDLVFSSDGMINNVEIFTCTIDVSDEYRFKIKSNTIIKGTEALNAAFFLTCTCSEKNISHNNYADTHHTVSCGDCGFSVQEKHRFVETTKSSSYGIDVTFKVYYLPQKFPGAAREFDYLGGISAYWSGGFTGYLVETMIIYGGTNEITSTGEIITRTYEIVVKRLSDGVYLFPQISVTAIIDYFDQTILLS